MELAYCRIADHIHNHIVDSYNMHRDCKIAAVQGIPGLDFGAAAVRVDALMAHGAVSHSHGSIESDAIGNHQHLKIEGNSDFLLLREAFDLLVSKPPKMP